MSRIRRMTIAVTAAVLTVTALPATAHADDTVSPPRPLGLPQYMTWGIPDAVNNDGTIVGVTGQTYYSCSLRATVWSGAYTVKVFETPGAWSRAYGVDSAGNAVGFVSDSATTGDCHTALPHAIRWDAAGGYTLLAPQTPGYSVATAIDDAGDIVGYSFTDPANAIPVKFVGGQAVPLVTDGSVPMDAQRTLGIDDYFRPGLTLTNLPSGNIAFGSQRSTSSPLPSQLAFATPVGSDTPIPAGTAHEMGGVSDAGIATSADGTVILGGTKYPYLSYTGTVWTRYRQLHTYGYRAYSLLIADGEGITPEAISPDGTLGVGDAQSDGRSGWLINVANVKNLPSLFSLAQESTTTGITDSGLMIGFVDNQQPVTWQYNK